MTVENGVAAANRYEYGRGTRQARRSDGTWLPLHYVSQDLEKILAAVDQSPLSWLGQCFSLMLQALASCSLSQGRTLYLYGKKSFYFLLLFYLAI